MADQERRVDLAFENHVEKLRRVFLDVGLACANGETLLHDRAHWNGVGKAAIDGMWKEYWKHWAGITRQEMGDAFIALIPELAALCPPAQLIDKRVYSPWLAPDLELALGERRCNTLIVTGGETDVCVLASVLGAVDRGFRVIVVTDAICSSADVTHDAVMTVYGSRFGQQVDGRDRPHPGSVALTLYRFDSMG